MALAIAPLLAVQSVMNGFDREMRDRILSLVPHVQITGNADTRQWNDLRDRVEADSSVASAEVYSGRRIADAGAIGVGREADGRRPRITRRLSAPYIAGVGQLAARFTRAGRVHGFDSVSS